MPPLASAVLRGILILFATFLAARLTFADPPPSECDRRLDLCRGSCFDRFARDAPSLARCRERCNQAWLTCGK
jgi:hypothetical protein